MIAAWPNQHTWLSSADRIGLLRQKFDIGITDALRLLVRRHRPPPDSSMPSNHYRGPANQRRRPIGLT